MDQKNLDINKNIFIRQEATQAQEGSFFTLKGLEDFIDDSGYCRVTDENNKSIFAKKYKNINEKFRFMILVNNYHKLYNPISIYGNEKEDPFKNSTIRSDKKFIEVSENCFNYYVSFLTTKNPIWLTKSEREV